jgi:predicted cupin superfamily sugar epimerase
MKRNNADYWIEKLALEKHIEGGYYKQIYHSEKQCKEYNNRNLATCIFYLLSGNDYSAFHKINGDEIWHFFIGSSLTIYIINEASSELKIEKIGSNLDKQENLQLVIQEGNWLAAEVNDKSSFTLVGCTVIPGFDFKYFEMAKRNSLIYKYPRFKQIIEKLTKE